MPQIMSRMVIPKIAIASIMKKRQKADVDNDGDFDIMLINNGDPKLPAGSYLRNNGGMQFTFVKAAKSSNIHRLPHSVFTK